MGPGPVPRNAAGSTRRGARGPGGAAAHPAPDIDETLQHPRCVFQVLKRHFARYTPEMVAEVCGVPEEAFTRVARAHHRELGPGPDHRLRLQRRVDPAHGRRAVHQDGRDPAGAARQHRPPRRRDHGAARTRLHPGIHRHPHPVRHAARVPGDAARARQDNLDSYVEAEKFGKGFWANARDYMASLLKAWWGEAATAGNDFCYDYLPRLTGSHSTYETMLRQITAPVGGTSCSARTRRSARPIRRMQRLGMANLDWLVVRDFFADRERHLVEGWAGDRDRRDAHRGPQDRGVLPAGRRAHRKGRAASPTPSGCCSGTSKAVEPAGDARSDLWFAYHLGSQDPGEAGRNPGDEMDRPRPRIRRPRTTR